MVGEKITNCKKGKMVRIRYTHQESGEWRITGLMSDNEAKQLMNSNLLKQPQIVEDSEYN